MVYHLMTAQAMNNRAPDQTIKVTFVRPSLGRISHIIHVQSKKIKFSHVYIYTGKTHISFVGIIIYSTNNIYCVDPDQHMFKIGYFLSHASFHWIC